MGTIPSPFLPSRPQSLQNFHTFGICSANVFTCSVSWLIKTFMGLELLVYNVLSSIFVKTPPLILSKPSLFYSHFHDILTSVPSFSTGSLLDSSQCTYYFHQFFYFICISFSDFFKESLLSSQILNKIFQSWFLHDSHL